MFSKPDMGLDLGLVFWIQVYGYGCGLQSGFIVRV